MLGGSGAGSVLMPTGSGCGYRYAHCCQGCGECNGNGDGCCGDIADGDVAGDWGDINTFCGDCGERNAYAQHSTFTIQRYVPHCTLKAFQTKPKTKNWQISLFSLIHLNFNDQSALGIKKHGRYSQIFDKITTLKEENCYVIIVTNYGTEKTYLQRGHFLSLFRQRAQMIWPERHWRIFLAGWHKW